MRTDSVTIQYTVFALQIVTCVVGLLGNTAVICVSSCILKKTKSKIWFLNLAVADLIFLLFLPLNTVTLFNGNWSFGLHLCKLYNFTYVCNMYASIFIIAALNIDRVLSVAKPIWHHKFITKSIYYTVCALIWTVTILASLPVIFVSVEYNNKGKTECRLYDVGHFDCKDNSSETWSTFNESYFFNKNSQILENNVTEPDLSQTMRQNETMDDLNNGSTYNSPNISYFSIPLIPHNIPQCFDNGYLMDSETLESWNKMIHLTESIIIPLLIIGYIVPLSVILCSNVIIILSVRKSQAVKTLRMYRIIVTVVVVYFLTCTPLVVGEVIILISAHKMNFELMKNVIDTLPLLYNIAYMNSCLNPIVYVLVGTKVRVTITEFFSTTRQSMSSFSFSDPKRHVNSEKHTSSSHKHSSHSSL
ncbi:C3a anaphylatoxin chemotactic receptor-like [Pelobates fuscus]|uniref:C3a anaphylatoxin chemotactic receptor-like n=1 Tax=Pelobates fuscus TaxID=191477 RepID=UPI002FE43BAB